MNFYRPLYSARITPSKETLNELSVKAKANDSIREMVDFLAISTLDILKENFGEDLRSQTSVELQENSFIHFGQVHYMMIFMKKIQ